MVATAGVAVAVMVLAPGFNVPALAIWKSAATLVILVLVCIALALIKRRNDKHSDYHGPRPFKPPSGSQTLA